VAASLSYIFNVLAFTGSFEMIRWTVFAGLFVGIMYGFEKFINRVEALEG
jgi:hypothetical protein